MNFGFVSTRFAGTDGVSLEAAKWAEVLWRDGHVAHWFSGLSDRQAEISMVVPEAHFAHPEIEWINQQPRLRGALAAITAAVVGVILNLAVWFALHVFFRDVTVVRAGPFNLWTPDLQTIDWRVVVLAMVSAVLLLWRHMSIPWVLAVASSLALAMVFAAG